MRYIYEVCFRRDTGLVVSIRPTGSIWSQIELGQELAPNGRSFSVSSGTSLISFTEGWEMWENCVMVVDNTDNPQSYEVYDRRNPAHAAIIDRVTK